MRTVFCLFEQLTNSELRHAQQSVKMYIFDVNLMLGALIFFYHHHPTSDSIALRATVGNEKPRTRDLGK